MCKTATRGILVVVHCWKVNVLHNYNPGFDISFVLDVWFRR